MNKHRTLHLLPITVFLLALWAGAVAGAAAIPPVSPLPGPPKRDMEVPPDTAFALTDKLHLGLEFELEYTLDNNFDLDDRNPDDLEVLQVQTSLALAYVPSPRATFFLDLDLSQDFAFDQQGEEESLAELELKELNLTLREPSSRWKLEAGRIEFSDERQWLYDEGLDGLRLSYQVPSDLTAMLAASRKHDIELLRRGEEDQADYFEFRLSRDPDNGRVVSLYALARQDREEGHEDPVFIGLQSEGELLDDLEYWLELAYAGGHGENGRIEATGLDFGAVYEFGELALQPSLILGYAYGSGDGDPVDHRDRDFRQSGLQDNEAKFAGGVSSEYYGVLLQPELSNLRIFTAGAGIKPLRNGSLELLYHGYRQDKVSAAIRDAEPNKDPNGISKELGYEIDLVAGYETKHVETKLAVGYFRPGDAFADPGAGRDDDALFLEFTIQYEF